MDINLQTHWHFEVLKEGKKWLDWLSLSIYDGKNGVFIMKKKITLKEYRE